MGLTTRSIDVLSLIEKYVPTFHIEEVSRPKFSKNGYRFDTKVFVPMV